MARYAQRTDGEGSRRQIIDALRSLQAVGKHPTSLELAQKAGISRSNTRYHVGILTDEGLVSIREIPVVSFRREIVLVDPPSGAAVEAPP